MMKNVLGFFLSIFFIFSFSAHPEQLNCSTADDYTYFSRGTQHKQHKFNVIHDFVCSRLSDIKSILDIGCNNGSLSLPYLRYGVDVLGIDASDNLRIAPEYSFKHLDIVRSREIFFKDCTFFLSVYHHMFFLKGREWADQLFYKFLLRTNVLVFDCGNVEEVNRGRHGWLEAQLKHFKSEKELLDHFGLPYSKIGQWESGGGFRSLVVFEKKDFDNAVEVVDVFREAKDKAFQKYGLVSVKGMESAHEVEVEGENVILNTDLLFYKLKLNDHYFLAKKDSTIRDIQAELTDVVARYEQPLSEELADFYGLSDKFGFVFQWKNTTTSTRSVSMKMSRDAEFNFAHTLIKG